MRRVLAILILIGIASGAAVYGVPVDQNAAGRTSPEDEAPQSEDGSTESSQEDESDLGLPGVVLLALPLACLLLSGRSGLFCRPGCLPVLPQPPQIQLPG
jgi:hypothetical protein